MSELRAKAIEKRFQSADEMSRALSMVQQQCDMPRDQTLSRFSSS